MKEKLFKRIQFYFWLPRFRIIQELFQNILIIVLYSMGVDWKVIYIRLYLEKNYWIKLLNKIESIIY